MSILKSLLNNRYNKISSESKEFNDNLPNIGKSDFKIIDGCDYCVDGKAIVDSEYADIPRIWIDTVEHTMSVFIDHPFRGRVCVASFHIDYCPMCGKPL